MKKLLSTVMASLIAVSMLVGCGGGTAVPTDDYTETSPDTETSDVLTDAFERYAIVISQPYKYDFDNVGVDPTGNYRYALVQMSAEDAVPTLIVEQETADLYYVSLFRYDPNARAVIQPFSGENLLCEGTSSMSGYRSTLSIMKDGNGLRITRASGGNIYVYRITLDEDTSMGIHKPWEGKIGDEVPAEYDCYDIIWHSTQDSSALNPESVQRAPEQSVDTGTEPETDVDDGRIRLSGTLDRYGYDQVVSMQGKPDPNGAYANTSATYALVVLDEPQDLTFQTIDGADTRNVWALRVSNIDELEQYVGQHITFSVDPYEGMFPADTSMPIGQPSAEIQVLN